MHSALRTVATEQLWMNSIPSSKPDSKLKQMAPRPETQFIRACSANNSELVRELLVSGTPVETRDSYGLGGLIWAGRKGHVAVAEVLLAAGADLEAKDRRDRTCLHHAVALNRTSFVEFITQKGALLNPVDMHGCTPLDLATMSGSKIATFLEQVGAKRSKSEKPLEKRAGVNRFVSYGATGGPNHPIEVDRVRVQLKTLLRGWTGDYSPEIEDFCFAIYEDGSVIRYTETMNFVGPQKARRSGIYLTVKIGIPEDWWNKGAAIYKNHLVESIGAGLASMIGLLKRNKSQIDADRLLADWARLSKEFLDT